MVEEMEHDSDPLHRVFAPLIGLPAWSVKQGYGSFLTFEFGEPHLEVREPIVAHHSTSERARERLARRRVYVHGDWHLWIYCCSWRVSSNVKEIAWSESPDDKMTAAADHLDSQLLLGVTADPTKGTSTFRFEDGSLETWPFDDHENCEQWMLYLRSGDVLTYRADGHYQICPASEGNNDLGWRPLP